MHRRTVNLKGRARRHSEHWGRTQARPRLVHAGPSLVPNVRRIVALSGKAMPSLATWSTRARNLHGWAHTLCLPGAALPRSASDGHHCAVTDMARSDTMCHRVRARGAPYRLTDHSLQVSYPVRKPCPFRDRCSAARYTPRIIAVHPWPSLPRDPSRSHSARRWCCWA